MSDQMNEETLAAVRGVLGWTPLGTNNTLMGLAEARCAASMRRDAVRERACLLAIRAVVDSELGAPSPADLRAEALAALEAMRTLIGIDGPIAASALDSRAGLDMGIDTMLRGIREDAVPEVKAACYHAVVALIRWREAKEVARG